MPSRFDLRLPIISIGFIVILLVGSYVTASRPQHEWFMYLNDTAQHQLLRLYLDGHIETVPVFPIGQYSRDVNYSFDGRYRAACEFDNTSGTHRFQIYDLTDSARKIDLDFGKIAYCGNSLFSADGKYSVVGILNYTPLPDYMEHVCSYPKLPSYPEECTEKRTKPVWQIFVMDVKSGKIIHEINAETPSFVAFPKSNSQFPYRDDYFMPQVFSVDDNEITFAGMIWYPIDTPPLYFGAWNWQFKNDGIESDTLILKNYDEGRITTNGESVWLETDYCLPVGYHFEGSGYDLSPNLVRVVNANGKNSVIYFNGEAGIRSVRFINDGEQLAIQLYGDYGKNIPVTGATYKWVILDRDGVTQEYTKHVDRQNDSDIDFLFDPIDIMPAPNGYMMFDRNSQAINNSPQYQLNYYSGGMKHILWQGSNLGIEWYPQALNTTHYLPDFTGITPEVPPDFVMDPIAKYMSKTQCKS